MLLTAEKDKTQQTIVNESLASIERRLDILKKSKDDNDQRYRELSKSIDDVNAELSLIDDATESIQAANDKYNRIVRQTGTIIRKPIIDGADTRVGNLQTIRDRRERERNELLAEQNQVSNFPTKLKQLKELRAERKAQIKRMKGADGYTAGADDIVLQTHEYKEVFAKYRLNDPNILTGERDELAARLNEYDTYRDQLIKDWIVDNEVVTYEARAIRFTNKLGSVHGSVLYRTQAHNDGIIQSHKVDGASQSITVLGEHGDIDSLVMKFAKESGRKARRAGVGFNAPEILIRVELSNAGATFNSYTQHNNKADVTVI
jgi:chromosome segregation ATPase